VCLLTEQPTFPQTEIGINTPPPQFWDCFILLFSWVGITVGSEESQSLPNRTGLG
jgi:hypothetical protein